MNEFTKFEHQYILILAARAKHQLEHPAEHIDPNVPAYIEALESIVKKAGENMKEQAQEEK